MEPRICMVRISMEARKRSVWAGMWDLVISPTWWSGCCAANSAGGRRVLPGCMTGWSGEAAAVVFEDGVG